MTKKIIFHFSPLMILEHDHTLIQKENRGISEDIKKCINNMRDSGISPNQILNFVWLQYEIQLSTPEISNIGSSKHSLETNQTNALREYIESNGDLFKSYIQEDFEDIKCLGVFTQT